MMNQDLRSLVQDNRAAGQLCARDRRVLARILGRAAQAQPAATSGVAPAPSLSSTVARAA